MKPIKVTQNTPELVKKAQEAERAKSNAKMPEAPEKNTAEDEAENVEATKGDPKYDANGELIPADPDEGGQVVYASEEDEEAAEEANEAAQEGDPNAPGAPDVRDPEVIASEAGVDLAVYRAKRDQLAELRERTKALSAEIKSMKGKIGRVPQTNEEKMKLPDDVGELDDNWKELHKVLGSGMQVAVLKSREMTRTKVAKRFGVKPAKIQYEITEAVKVLKQPQHKDLVKRTGLETFLANRK